jgi:hypothetical protein
MYRIHVKHGFILCACIALGKKGKKNEQFGFAMTSFCADALLALVIIISIACDLRTLCIRCLRRCCFWSYTVAGSW